MDFDYRLLAKYLTGMLSPEEMKQVEEWRKLSIDNEEVFSELMKLRVSWKFTQYNTPEHIEEALNGLNAKINSRRRFQILRSVMRYAAVILLFVSFSYVGLSETGQLCNDQGGTRGRCEKNRACGWIGCLVKGGVFFEDT
jgi:ferric-dicitrate binding protein FerR (iron transport regulator)